MKIIFSVLLFTFLLFVTAWFMPVTFKQEIAVEAPLNNISNALLNLEKWRYWHPSIRTVSDSGKIIYNTTKAGHPIITSKESTIELRNSSALGILVRETSLTKNRWYSLFIIPQGNDPTYIISLKEKGNLLQWTVRNLRGSEKNKILSTLKSYIENPANYYGFPIHLGDVVDTIVVTKEFTCATDHLYKKLEKTFGELNEYIKSNNLTVTHKKIAFIQYRNKDTLQVMAGVPVNKEADKQEHLYYQRMPKGRMLIGRYEGRYSELHKLYAAMSQYIIDYSLKPVALSYEKYLSDQPPASTESHVVIDVYFPIF